MKKGSPSTENKQASDPVITTTKSPATHTVAAKDMSTSIDNSKKNSKIVKTAQTKKKLHLPKLAFPQIALPKFSFKLPTFFKKKVDNKVKSAKVEQKKETPIKATSLETTEQPQKVAKKITVLEVLEVFVKVFLTVGTLVIFLWLLPYLFRDPANTIQKFVNATNFTIEPASNNIAKISSQPELMTDGSGHTNILMVGIDSRPKGTKGSGGANTDTIIFASYNHQTNNVAMFSFPRDSLVKYPGTSTLGKINATYAVGRFWRKGNGMEYLKSLIEDITGQKIQYYVLVDMQVVRSTVDAIGGIDVYVDNSFTDYSYPTENFGYQKISFTKGWTHMNGDLVLKYSRSRHAQQNGEGSDYARAKRQQKVIQAIMDKIQSQETLQSPQKIFSILDGVADNIELNQLTTEDILAGINILRTKGKPVIYNTVMDPRVANGTIMQQGGPTGYGSILSPRAGGTNYGMARTFISDMVNDPTYIALNPKIAIYNGGSSDYNGKYKRTTSRFFYILMSKGGDTDNYSRDTVFNTGGKDYTSMAQWLAKELNANYVDATDPNVKAPRNKGTPISIVFSD